MAELKAAAGKKGPMSEYILMYFCSNQRHIYT